MPTSSDAAIRVEGLGKRYELGRTTGTARFRYRSLRQDLADGFARRLKARGRRAETREFWALRDVSFDVQPGERVGIIGRNGAGKSTLLKMLSRITVPTEGRAELRGRLGALLEVGTGFHPELTGRDNIVLNGAILGMRRQEIRSKVDEIVEFSGIGRFLDTPVKRYSSGMYLRLAFSVAAHLDPEILVVDEVLAVGDADFQKKCLGRMEDIGRSGRTVLFVSHSMPAILRLCDRVLLLDKGRVIADGSAQEITRTYLDSGLGSAGERHWTNPDEAPGDDVVRIKSVTVRTAAGVSEEIDIREPVDVTVEYWQLGAAGEPPYVNLHIFNDDGVLLFVTNDYNNQEWWRTPRGAGLVTATCRIPGNFFAEGRIFVMAAISTMKPVVTIHVLERDAVSFQVVDQTHGDGVRGEWAGEYPGVVRPMLEWDVRLHRTPETNDVVQAEEGVAR